MLTEAEIDALEGRALDAAVAEYVLGEPMPPLGVHDPGHVMSAVTSGKAWVCVLDYYQGDECNWRPRLFSTDWGAAGLVIDAMRQRVDDWSVNAECNASFLLKDWHHACAVTPQLAICRAALKAIVSQAK